MILHIDNPKDSTKNLLELLNEFSKLAGYKIHIQKSVAYFLDYLFIYLFLERGEGEREGKIHQCMVASFVPPTGDLACNPGMCPDWELNR